MVLPKFVPLGTVVERRCNLQARRAIGTQYFFVTVNSFDVANVF